MHKSIPFRSRDLQIHQTQTFRHVNRNSPICLSMDNVFPHKVSNWAPRSSETFPCSFARTSKFHIIRSRQWQETLHLFQCVTRQASAAPAGGGESVLPREDRRQPIHQIVIGFVLGFPQNSVPNRLASRTEENYPTGTCYLGHMWVCQNQHVVARAESCLTHVLQQSNPFAIRIGCQRRRLYFSFPQLAATRFPFPAGVVAQREPKEVRLARKSYVTQLSLNVFSGWLLMLELRRFSLGDW